jgi:hypothetical protein
MTGGRLAFEMSRLPMKQVLMFCDCGNRMAATVFRDIPFDLTCSKCKRHYVGGSCEMMVYRDGVFQKWEGKIKEKNV